MFLNAFRATHATYELNSLHASKSFKSWRSQTGTAFALAQLLVLSPFAHNVFKVLGHQVCCSHKVAVSVSTIRQFFCMGVKLFTPASSFVSSASTSGSWLQSSNCSDTSLWHLCVPWTLFSCLCFFLSSSCFSLRSSPPILAFLSLIIDSRNLLSSSFLIWSIASSGQSIPVLSNAFEYSFSCPGDLLTFGIFWSSWHPPKSSSFFHCYFPELWISIPATPNKVSIWG